MVPGSDRGLKSGMDQAKLSKQNKILAPKLFPIWSYGAMTNFDKVELDDPKMLQFKTNVCKRSSCC